MNRETSRGQQVLDWLKAEKQGYEALLALLDQEYECLKHRDITRLIPLTRVKGTGSWSFMNWLKKSGLFYRRKKRPAKERKSEDPSAGRRSQPQPLGSPPGQGSKIHPEDKNGNPGPE